MRKGTKTDAKEKKVSKPSLFLVKSNDEKPDESAVAKQISSGNSAAFSVYVREKAKFFYHVAYRVTLNREAAEDVVQNAFAKLWEKRESIQADGNMSAWLYRVVVNLAIDTKRGAKFSELHENIEGADGTQDEEKRDLTAKIEKVLAVLPPRQRAAIMMVYYDGYGQKEAAEIMGVNLKALESLLSRAKLALKEKLI